ncbi:MAG TPA: RnfH family protein [Psychrobacter pasteurii]|nr:RnfH family protein [Psychrobacter pasteurii]
MIESSLNIFDKAQAGLPISLAYAPSATQSLYLEMEVAEGTTLLQALQQSGWLQQYPDLQQWCDEHAQDEQINNKTWAVGVFAQKKLLSYVLQAHDRIEIYRPLTIDPMRKRKKRAIRQ